MKLNLIGILLALSPLCASAATPAASQTLEGSFRSALIRSEVIGTQMELINQAEENYKQAVGSVLPSVSLVGSYLRQETPSTSANLFPGGQPLLKLSATQPIFHGLREYAALRQAGKLRDATSADAVQARVTLFSNVAQNFFTILSLEKTLANYKNEVESYNDRIKELRQRIRIGRSRESEVLTVEASLTTVMAQIENTKGQLRVAREAYAFLTGLPQETSLQDDQPLVRALPQVDFYTHRVEERPDVRASEIRLNATEENMDIARGQRLPQVDFTANYYLKRFGATQDVHWDIQFLASLPLYAGGKIDSSERIAASQTRQSELAVSQTRRQAEDEIRSLYQTYMADRNQVEALTKNKTVASKNLKVQSADYRLGLVTNLDVLQALIQFQESERALDQAIFAAKLDYVRLENASAKNPMIGVEAPKPKP